MQYKFSHLRPICSSMRRNRKSLEQFDFVYNDIKFDCIIDIDAHPFEIMVGALKYNFAFILYVHPGFITEMKNEDYYKLCQILNLNYKEHHFSSFAFLTLIDNNIPSESSPAPVPLKYIYPFRKNTLSKAEREEGFIFCGWLPHKGRHNGHVQNLAKTEKLLGKSIAAYCEKNNISSKWTTDITKEKDISFPWDNP